VTYPGLKGKTVALVGHGSDKTKISFPGYAGGESAINFDYGWSSKRQQMKGTPVTLTADAEMGTKTVAVDSVASFSIGTVVEVSHHDGIHHYHRHHAGR